MLKDDGVPFFRGGHKDQQKVEPTDNIPTLHSFRPWRFTNGIISRTEVEVWFAKKAPQRIISKEYITRNDIENLSSTVIYAIVCL